MIKWLKNLLSDKSDPKVKCNYRMQKSLLNSIRLCAECEHSNCTVTKCNHPKNKAMDIEVGGLCSYFDKDKKLNLKE